MPCWCGKGGEFFCKVCGEMHCAEHDCACFACPCPSHKTMAEARKCAQDGPGAP